MGQKEKLEQRFKSVPKDWTFDEMTALLGYYGFTLSNAGKTGGSRVKFIHKGKGIVIMMHKPHDANGKNVVKTYMIRQVLKQLEEEGLL